MARPQGRFDQFRGKASAELHRGCGWWPLQPHPCALEPPWEPFDRNHVTLWDCYINDWDGPFVGNWLSRTLFGGRPLLSDNQMVVLREEPCGTWEGLVPVVVEQFNTDESTIPKAEQFLLSMPVLRRPIAFEVCGVGRQPKYDYQKMGELAKNGLKKGDWAKIRKETQCGWIDSYTQVQFVCHEHDAAIVQRQLLVQYPNSAVTIGDDLTNDDLEPGKIMYGDGLAAVFALEAPYTMPLRVFGRLDPDPLAVAIAAMEDLATEEWALLQIVFQPAVCDWSDNIRQAVIDPYRPNEIIFNDIDQRTLAEKFQCPLFAVSVRIAAKSKGVYQHLIGWAEQFAAPPQRLGVNAMHWDDDELPEFEREKLGWSLQARCTHRPGMLLNAQELASMVHLPAETVASERLRRVRARTRPVRIEEAPKQSGVFLGKNIHQGRERGARVPETLRARHCYIAGASGTGKSTLLLNLIIQDICAGHGVGVLDPHGDLINDVLRRIPDSRIRDVILFDPSDRKFPMALNILEAKDAEERERIVAETVMALERFFPTSWGPRLERILTYTIHTVLHAIPKATLADVERMLTDAAFREQVLQATVDLRFLQFWQTQFNLFPKNAVDPVLNKLSVFLLNPTVRNIVCQRKSAVDFDAVLNGRKIFLANLSTGLLTEKIAGVFGSFLVTKIVNAAFRRAAMAEHKRLPFYLYVDEFQAFMNLSVGFDRILAEARKYKLVLAGLANQYVGQLSLPVRHAVFGNVGTFVSFRLGVDDAQILAKEMGEFTAEEILNLQMGQAIVRTGGSDTAFNLTTYPPPPIPANDPTGKIVQITRNKYARSRKVVERELAQEEIFPKKQQSPKKKRKRGKPPSGPDGDPDLDDDLVS